jgi:ABC-type enterochelin transport system substrate-binding protein
MTAKPEKAERLQESDVHEVCRQLISTGQKPTVVKLFNQLQRGSMTTIQKFLNTFNDDLTDNSGAVELPKFDALADETVKLSFDALMAKVYKIAYDKAREDFTGEKDRLTAEITALNAELVECREFSDSQSGLIETLEKTTEQLNADTTKLKIAADELNNRILMLSVENGKLSGMIEVYNALGGSSAIDEKPSNKPRAKAKNLSENEDKK